MINKISTHKKKGFSLIELCITIGIFAILAGSLTPVFIKRVQIKAAEKAALEVSIIQDATRAYFIANNAWPANLSVLKNAGYLDHSWNTNNPWQNAYIISSNGNSLTVSTTVPQEWTNLVARDLPASFVSANTVNSTVANPGNITSETLPQGTIVMWSGNITSIPLGWVLCDGTNGTPDLRDKFIVGARQDLGGIARTNLTGSLTQSGGASVLTGISGSHQLTVLELPAHQHTYTIAGDWRGSQTKASGGDDNPTAPWPMDIPTGSTGGNQGHTHPTEIPPYYALAFIMKV